MATLYLVSIGYCPVCGGQWTHRRSIRDRRYCSRRLVCGTGRLVWPDPRMPPGKDGDSWDRLADILDGAATRLGIERESVPEDIDALAGAGAVSRQEARRLRAFWAEQ